MQILIEYEHKPDWPFAIDQVAKAVIEECVEYEHCPYEIQLNLLLTDDETIKSINYEQRNINAPTDVLSFPLVSYEQPADFGAVEADPFGCFDPDSGELLLGDIVISVERTEEQANTYGHSVKREYAFLLVHSMLHLFGYDHIEESDRIIMEKRQKEILNILNIPR